MAIITKSKHYDFILGYIMYMQVLTTSTNINICI